MITLSPRPYAGEPDLQPLVDLINACEAVDRIDWGTSPGELRSEIEYPGIDPAHDLRIWEDEAGRLVAFSQIHIRSSEQDVEGHLWFTVHPAARNAWLEQQIDAWSLQRMQEAQREHGLPARLLTGARTDDVWRPALVQQQSYQPVRYFLRMVRPLDQPIPEPQLPPGFSIRPLQGSAEVPAVVELFNHSFIDHWNFHPTTPELRLHSMNEPGYRPELDLLAVAPDGTLVAFAYCFISEEENRRTGREEGWVRVLGTRRGFRGMGLGRAILLAGLRCLREAGAELGVLGVDAANPTGATRLYESVGFQPKHTFVLYERWV